MTILRPPTRTSSHKGGHWFLWAVGGVVIALVLIMAVVKSLMSDRAAMPPPTSKADVVHEAIEVGPGLRFEVLIPATETQGSKETPAPGGKDKPKAGKTKP